MLMNNLDPEVAERPDDLVVYGGTGKAARTGRRSTRSCARCATLERRRDAARAVGKPVGVFRTHEWAPRVLIANSNLVPTGRTGRSSAARGPRPDDVRPDDRRLVDLHRHPGHPAGHLRDLRRVAAQALRRHARRHDHAHRRPRRHGRRAAARGDDERRRRALHRGRPSRISAGSSTATSTRQADSLDDALARGRARRATSARPLSIGCSATPPTSARAARARRRSTSSPTRPRRTTRSTATSRRLSLEDWRALRAARPGRSTSSARGSRWPRTCGRWSSSRTRGAEVFDYGNNDPREAAKGGVDRAFDFPGFVPAYIRPLFCEGKGPFRWAALSGDPADIAATDRRSSSSSPTTSRCCTLDHDGAASGSRSRACRRASAGSATASAHLAGLRVQRAGRSGRVSRRRS
jgi:urocanate hydratase